MATVYAEHNRVNWVGVRPGVSGDPINKYGTVINGSLTIYTVPADKILLIFNSYAILTSEGAAGGDADLRWSDATPAIVYRILGGRARPDSVLTSLTYSRFVPLEIPAAHLIRLYASLATVEISGGFEGILIDV